MSKQGLRIRTGRNHHNLIMFRLQSGAHGQSLYCLAGKACLFLWNWMIHKSFFPLKAGITYELVLKEMLGVLRVYLNQENARLHLGWGNELKGGFLTFTHLVTSWVVEKLATPQPLLYSLSRNLSSSNKGFSLHSLLPILFCM